MAGRTCWRSPCRHRLGFFGDHERREKTGLRSGEPALHPHPAIFVLLLVDVAQRVEPSERLVAELEQICGSGTVELR